MYATSSVPYFSLGIHSHHHQQAWWRKYGAAVVVVREHRNSIFTAELEVRNEEQEDRTPDRTGRISAVRGPHACTIKIEIKV